MRIVSRDTRQCITQQDLSICKGSCSVTGVIHRNYPAKGSTLINTSTHIVGFAYGQVCDLTIDRLTHCIRSNAIYGGGGSVCDGTCSNVRGSHCIRCRTYDCLARVQIIIQVTYRIDGGAAFICRFVVGNGHRSEQRRESTISDVKTIMEHIPC